MRFANKAMVAGGLGFAVSALVGCGASGGLLSAQQASDLNNQLEQVSAGVTQRQCGAVDTAVAALNRSIAAMASVNQTLVNNLQQGVQTIGVLADQNCRGIFSTTTTSSTLTTSSSTTSATTTKTTSSTTTTTKTTTKTTPTSTTPTTTTTSTTTPTTTTSSTTTSTTTTPPAQTSTPTGGTGLSGGGTTGGGSLGGGSPTG